MAGPIAALFPPLSAPLSPLARYTQANGVFYLATGALFYAFPGALLLVPGYPPFEGHDEGLVRVLGMTVAIIGWLYIAGARTDRNSFTFATIADRAAVPFLLLPLVFTGAFPAPLGITFSVLDPVLALGAWAIARSARAEPAP